MKIRSKYKQYGFKFFMIGLYRAVFGKLGYRRETWLLLTQKIKLSDLMLPYISLEANVCKLTIQDFKVNNSFSNKKILSFEKRFESRDCLAYGLFCNNNLAYYCWISLSQFKFNNDLSIYKLDSNEGLLFDAFCFEKYRGRGFHNYMNIYRLRELINYNKTNAVVVVLDINRPARISQKRAGFKCFKVIVTQRIFGKFKSEIANKIVEL